MSSPVVSPTPVAVPAAIHTEHIVSLVKTKFGVEKVPLTAMPGGASTRRYFRVALPDEKSAVAMFVPEGAKAEEVQKAHNGTRWPFLEVRDLLAEHGVDVPNILAEDTPNGWLVIEDLGDETLANWLLRNPGDRESLYKRAVCDLARAQNELASLPEGCVVSSRNFDFDLLRWEIEHFREWGLDARGKQLASSSDLSAWNEIADRLAKKIAELPSGFVHRDYQSRNLMVVPKAPGGGGDTRLVWIDFQDALLGPRVYDLVALLNDSYQEFDRAFVEARLADYADAAALSHGFSIESRSHHLGTLPGSQTLRQLVDEFDLVTVQRKLKDAGRFVFIDRQKQNPAFLKFVTPTIKKVGGALARLAPTNPDMAELRGILTRALGDELG